MADIFSEAVPGVTLYFVGSTVSGGAGDVKCVVHLTLNAEVRDEAVWAPIEEKFRSTEGYRIFTHDDLQAEVARMMRAQIDTLESKVLELERSLRQSKDETKRALAELSQQRDAQERLALALSAR